MFVIIFFIFSLRLEYLYSHFVLYYMNLVVMLFHLNIHVATTFILNDVQV